MVSWDCLFVCLKRNTKQSESLKSGQVRNADSEFVCFFYCYCISTSALLQLLQRAQKRVRCDRQSSKGSFHRNSQMLTVDRVNIGEAICFFSSGLCDMIQKVPIDFGHVP